VQLGHVAVPARLTPATVEDDDALDELIGSWAIADGTVQSHQGEIDLLTGALQELSCDAQWDVADKLIANVEAQQHDLRVLVARRAFEDGRAFPKGVELPELDAGVLADPTRLGMAIDTVLQGDAGLRDLARQIVQAMHGVQGRVELSVWRNIVALDDLITRRAADAQGRLVHWAFRAGVRSGARR
jgi:hypothetical protein